MSLPLQKSQISNRKSQIVDAVVLRITYRI